MLLPVKAGQARSLAAHGLNIHRAAWIPDGKRVLIAGNEPDRALRLYLQSLEGEKPVPITPEGIAIGSFPVSPDGERVVAQAGDQKHFLFPLGEGEAEPIAGLGPEDRPIRFSLGRPAPCTASGAASFRATPSGWIFRPARRTRAGSSCRRIPRASSRSCPFS